MLSGVEHEFFCITSGPGSLIIINSLHTSDNLSCLLITLVNSLDPGQAG